MLFTNDSPIGRWSMQALIRFLPLEENSTVIGIGCGRGEFLIELSRMYSIRGILIQLLPLLSSLRSYRWH